jgi:predicted DNA-binding mobile mystery protein A
MKAQKKLQIEQMDKKLAKFSSLDNISVPSKGWLNSIRITLNMSLKQFGRRLNITAQSAKEIEEREISGSITLKNLSEAAAAQNMRLVYGFIPNDGSLSSMIEKRALEKAKEIVLRTSQSMSLEDQENKPERIEKAIKEKTESIKNELPRYLWD